ncbi:MAG: ubiquitin family protein [Aigarchaeota archaeon]|nr:ubiquitin family protein [Aigarchaeota archaeon]MDW8092498.1 ubiquitin-like domain-containing protein [Nitrososphaerota archaeon]
MKIRVVPAVGGGPPIELDVPPNASIGAIKLKVCSMKKLRPDDTRLTYKGRALNDSDILSAVGVEEGDKLVLITRTVGGR